MKRQFRREPVLAAIADSSFVNVQLKDELGGNTPISEYFTETEIDSFIDAATSAVTNVVSSYEIKNLQLVLNIRYYPVNTYGSADRRPRALMYAKLTSKSINPKWYLYGGRSSNEPRINYYSSDALPNMLSFSRNVSEYVADVAKDAKRLAKFSTKFLGVDQSVLEAAKNLIYWIDTEKLGRDPSKNPLGLDRRVYLKFRTYDNTRGNYYHDEDMLNDINLLCDYADDMNMYNSDLIKFAREAAFFVQRNPHD